MKAILPNLPRLRNQNKANSERPSKRRKTGARIKVPPLRTDSVIRKRRTCPEKGKVRQKMNIHPFRRWLIGGALGACFSLGGVVLSLQGAQVETPPPPVILQAPAPSVPVTEPPVVEQALPP